MNQLFPTIYVSFDGFQRRQLKQELHRAFNQSLLNKLGFKLKLSPRTVIDFGTPDPQLAGEQCKQSALFVALLEEAAGHGSRQQMLHMELAQAVPEVGTEILLLSESDLPQLPEELGRLLGSHTDCCLQLEGDLASAIVAQMEASLCGAWKASSLDLLPDDFSIAGHQPQQAPENSPLLQALLNPEQDSQPQQLSPDMANLQQHHRWLSDNLSLANSSGAALSVQKCLALFDSDLTANYWRCRLLVDTASKESEFAELTQRAALVQRHIERNDYQAPELLAESLYYQAQGYVGQQQLSQAITTLQQALSHHINVALLYQLALRTLQKLAQQQTPTEQKDPSLLTAKQTCLQLLQQSLIGYQLATQQLLMKTPKDKLDMVILGVKQDVIAALRQVQQQEHELKQLCAEWELIITPQLSPEATANLLEKPVWNLIRIGQESVSNQLTLLQLSAQQLKHDADEVQQLEQDSDKLQTQQQELNTTIEQLRFSYQDTCKSRQLSWWGLAATGLLVTTLISGFWWMSISQVALLGLLGGDLLAFTLLALLLKKQSSRLAQLKQSCRALDQQYALEEDDLPEPRAQEGWFDRLSVRHDKLRDKCLLLRAKLKEASTRLHLRIPQLAQAQFNYSETSLSSLGGSFQPWLHEAGPANLLCIKNIEKSYALPEELVALAQSELVEPPTWLLVDGSEPAAPWASYFDQAPNPEHCKHFHLLQVAANNELTTETLLAPLGPQWQLNKWLVAEGDTVKAEQPLVELQNEDETLAIFAPKAGRVNKQLAQEGHELSPEQAVVELEVN